MGEPEFNESTTRIYLGTKTSSKQIELLEKCTSLTELVINGYRRSTLELNPLRNCSELEEIQLSRFPKVKHIDLNPLKNLQNLKELVLVDIPNLTSLDLTPVSECASLQRIWIAENSLELLDVEPILELKNLEILVLNDMPIRNLLGTSIESHAPLKELELNSLEDLQNLNLEFLSGAKLIEFYISRTNIAHVDLESIRNQKNLEKLEINFCRIKEIDLEPLSQFSKLKVLDLAGNHLRYIDLHPLSNCSSLHYISFAMNELEEIHLEPLGNLPVSNLLLSHNRIQEVDFTPVISSELNYLTFGLNTVARASKAVMHILEKSQAHILKYYHGTKTRRDGRIIEGEQTESGLNTIEWF
jgi:Leucine-rich repeat (LRR) protein